MEYTTNYQLPVWAETDRILRTDFNDLTDKLDGALNDLRKDVTENTDTLAGCGNCMVYAVTYTGTSINQPVVHSFPGKPVAFAVMELLGGRYALALRGVTNIPCAPGSSVSMEVTWGDNQVSWYEGNAANGYNDARFTYCLVVLLEKDA